MGKLPSQYVAYKRNIVKIGGAISLATANTTPVYTRPIYLADREMLHIMCDVFRDTGSAITDIYIKMVFHYDVNATATEWYTKVDPARAFFDDGSGDGVTVYDDQFGVHDRLRINFGVGGIKNPKSLPATERFSMIFKTGEMGARLPFGRWEVVTKGVPDGDDEITFRAPWEGPLGDPPEDPGSDPGSGQGDDIDP